MALSAAGVIVAGMAGVRMWRGLVPAQPPSHPERMLLAPMIGIQEPCIWATPALPGFEDLQAQCSGAQGSAAALVESTLQPLQPAAA
ncbi:hypothetical protein, partial [Raoultella sp. 18098]|uniref:hypothetical protein n=1 Tax=Raoultella sp. 18098 TaxID=2681430 RepID=UPI001D10AAD8